MHFCSDEQAFGLWYGPWQVYYTATQKSDGKRGWQSGGNLADSTTFTWQFCRALFHAWMNRNPDEPVIFSSDSESESSNVSSDDVTQSDADVDQNELVVAGSQE